MNRNLELKRILYRLAELYRHAPLEYFTEGTAFEGHIFEPAHTWSHYSDSQELVAVCLTSTTSAGPVASPENVTEILALISQRNQD